MMQAACPVASLCHEAVTKEQLNEIGLADHFVRFPELPSEIRQRVCYMLDCTDQLMLMSTSKGRGCQARASGV